MATLKFRQEALEQATSTEQLGQLIGIVSNKDWAILATLGFLLFTFVLWSIFGSIATRVTGQGILLADNAGIYDAVASFGSAHVINIKIKPGDQVVKGDVIAYLENPDLLKQFNVAQNYLQQMNGKYAALAAASQQEINQRQAQAAQQEELLQTGIKQETDHLARVQDLLERKQSLLKRGLITQQDIVNTFDDLYAVKQRIESSQTESIQNHVALTNFIEEWQQRLRDLDLHVADAQKEVDRLKAQLGVANEVRSPVSGTVSNIHVAIGDDVKDGQPIASIASEGSGLAAIVYVPAQNGQRVKPNAQALVSPDIIKKEEFGSLVGQVKTVSSFPSTPESMQALLHDSDLVKRFDQNGNPIALHIHILPDPNTYSGFKWTSTTGPTQKIRPGMIVTAQITVREQAPISLIIPLLRKTMGD